MLSRMCTRSLIDSASSLKSPVPKQFVPRNYVLRTYTRESRTTVKPRAPTLWEKVMSPPGPNAYSMGKGALAGGSLLGLGALCFYGTGLGTKTGAGAWDQSHMWPQYVKDRVSSTYTYFGSSIAVTAASAMAIFRTPAIMNIVMRSGWMSLLCTMTLMLGSGMMVRSMEYKPGFGPKQIAWLVHTGIMGGVLAPLCLLGGPILLRAAWITAGVVGGLSTVAVCAPSEQFLNLGGPLAIGLGVVFASSLAGMFLPPTTALGAGLYSMSLYGGLLLFSGFMLYDTQLIIKKAETYPLYGFDPYDPINASMSIYLDTLNIFIRIASILAGQGGNRRR